MANTATTTVVDGDGLSTVSWGAIIAGGIASAAVTLLLLALGIGLGFSVVSPWAGEGVSSTTLHISAGIYLIVVAMLASTVGGFIAGRLRARWAGVHADEVYFRDTAHGFMAWAFATVLSASLLGAATTSILASASAGSIPAAAAGATAAATNPTDGYVDTLLRGDPVRAGTTSTPAGDTASTRGELGRLLAGGMRRGGDVSAADRTYAARVVAARTGLSQADAEKRVTEVVTQAKQAADEARKAAAKLAFWLAASMLAGALAASLAAIEGGVFRDSRWYEPGWKRGQARV